MIYNYFQEVAGVDETIRDTAREWILGCAIAVIDK